MKTCLISNEDHKRSHTWAKLRSAGCTGRSAKRIIHRRERHETRKQLRDAIACND